MYTLSLTNARPCLLKGWRHKRVVTARNTALYTLAEMPARGNAHAYAQGLPCALTHLTDT